MPSRPDASQPSAPLTVGRYTLYDLLASGGMGSVHFGRFVGPAGFGRTVVIKKLHAQLAGEDEFVAMLMDEARMASRVRHPNVAQTIDVVESPEGLFVVMDYVHGESLARLLKTCKSQGRSAPPPIVVAIIAGALRGLHAAHEATDESGAPLGIIHRDVSPQNILVGSDGQPRVIDFGVAKASGRLTNTREGQLKGKLGYMSPEQLQGHPVDRRSDVYSASVVLYEALVGGKLFDGNSEGVLVGNILAGVKAPPSQKISLAKTIDQKTFQALQALDAVVLRGLARDPAARFATAREMAIALEEATKVASVDAVEEWVGRMSGPMLASRAEIVRRIESDPTRSLTPARSATMITPTPALGSSPQAMTYPTSTSSSGREEQSLVQPVRSRFGRWIAIALVTSTPTVLLASYAVWRVSHPPPPAASVAVAASPPPSAAAPAPSASPPPAPSAAPAAVAAVAPSASPSPPSTGAPSAAPAPAPPAEAAEEAPRPAPHAKHHAKDTPKPAKAAVDCDPPYTLDQGVRIPKPECL